MGRQLEKKPCPEGGNTIASTPSPSTHAFSPVASLQHLPQGFLTYQHSVHTHLPSECITLRQGGARGERESIYRERPERERERSPPSLSECPPHTHTAPPSTLTAPPGLAGQGRREQGTRNSTLPPPPCLAFFSCCLHTAPHAKQAAGFSPFFPSSTTTTTPPQARIQSAGPPAEALLVPL